DNSSGPWGRSRSFDSGIPRSTYQRKRSFVQYSNHFGASSGGTKYSSSICSNSRVRNTKLPGVISLRNDLPVCAIPNGGRFRLVVSTFAKLTNMPCAVSGRRYTSAADSSTGPAYVLNIRLNWRGSVNESCAPQLGHVWGSSSLSRRKRSLHTRQSTSGSVKFWRCPDASQMEGGLRIAASMPTTSSRNCTIERHHAFFTLRSISTPSGP